MGMLVIVNAPLQRQLRLCLLQLQPQICDLLDPFVDSSIRSIQLVLELCNTIIIVVPLVAVATAGDAATSSSSSRRRPAARRSM
jgi:hypothetical protein